MIRSRSQRGKFERQIAPRTLTVSPASTQSSGWWLPASNVSLTSEWNDDLRSLSAGDQIIRTITLTATDVLASALPDVVPLESRAISSTRIDAQRSQQLIGDTLTATRSFDFDLPHKAPSRCFWTRFGSTGGIPTRVNPR